MRRPVSIANMNSDPATLPQFDPYVSSVERMAMAALGHQSHQGGDIPLNSLLDGQVSAKLRETVPLRVRKERGAFFSSTKLRSAALGPWTHANEPTTPVLDPAIGAGDLLLEVAQQLNVGEDLIQTLVRWGAVLHGRDLEPAFVRLAKARLVLLAASKASAGKSPTGPSLEDVFPEIRVGDGLEVLRGGWSGGHIAMNPPFTYGPASQDIEWTRGRTSLAAVFLATAMDNAESGTRLTAILPDVIRTGSRYDRLRSLVSSRVQHLEVDSYGQFDPWTDVDVFVLRGVVGESASSSTSTQWWDLSTGRTLGDSFDVAVGPVVPHRDPECGSPQPYLHARTIPLGGEFNTCNAEQCGYKRRAFKPPFVVVRRTSRPGDRSRGVGTLIVGDEEVQVENHLIVLTPKDGSVDSCRSVVDLLDSSHARQWLDERIRCRHLTVRAISEMPWCES